MGASKHKIKVRRYRTNGTIHRKGMDATSCVRCVVTASSITEALAERPSQSSRTLHDGAASGPADSAAAIPAAGTATAVLADRHAVRAQTPAKHTYAAVQIQPWVRFARLG